MSVIMTTIVAIAVCAVIGYLLGSVNFAIIFTRIFTGKDVRDHGSGNAGMTNALRTSGKKVGILTLVFDMLKGVASSFIAMQIGPLLFRTFFSGQTISAIVPREWLATAPPGIAVLPDVAVFAAFAGIFCVLGHMFPIFHKFKGGKGVATFAGVTLVFAPLPMLISLGVFAVFVLITKIVSISSIVAVTAFAVLVWVFESGNFWRTHITVAAAIISLLIILKHHSNIKRLIKGEENKFGSKKTSSEQGDD